mmetsp:Transcript_25678/g.40285  ORF Transcript_25678/g.40285 Transcript_25678/m.40285 type:complete len:211 (+) Transcript_25678:204-836(+)|eukprot:CAMPEP_0201734982 /NCGR_PEP_ID=MMETSP0593-20130828/35901_1 /ASSEMBLY_ACC=CAM_ASM_000672 /TAXON_ID=267983 /ORGANISM="Skeletonema japonicum, Strain CCMP2506" /LENGTH=210 /DNA_ID=CAMNT_0048228457 /DNA_START=149 /DNA_END=781 /DNA_ORIENTATION=-
MTNATNAKSNGLVLSRSVFSFVLLLILMVTLSATSCKAFQMRHPTATRHTRSFTRAASSKNNEDFSDDRNSVEKDDTPETYGIRNTNSDNSPPQPIRKFTGAPSSTSLFTNRNNEQSSSSPSTNLQREREREFNLASNFERTIGIQAVLLLAAFIYMASVGLSGGITDGSDRNFYGEDEVDSVVIEQLERIRTDDAADVLSRESATTVRI